MSFKKFLASAFGFTSTAEAAIKADASSLVSKAKGLEHKIDDVFHPGLPSSPIGYNTGVLATGSSYPAPPSIVGSTVSNLVTISGSFGKTIDSLVIQVEQLEDELRQRRASRSATVVALSSLANDPALTDDERTAISLEIADYTDDASAAAIKAQPTPENEPTDAPAPAPLEIPPSPGAAFVPISTDPVLSVGFTGKLK